MVWSSLLIVIGLLILAIFGLSGPFPAMMVLPPLIVTMAILLAMVTFPMWHRRRLRHRPQRFAKHH